MMHCPRRMRRDFASVSLDLASGVDLRCHAYDIAKRMSLGRLYFRMTPKTPKSTLNETVRFSTPRGQCTRVDVPSKPLPRGSMAIPG